MIYDIFNKTILFDSWIISSHQTEYISRIHFLPFQWSPDSTDSDNYHLINFPIINFRKRQMKLIAAFSLSLRSISLFPFFFSAMDLAWSTSSKWLAFYRILTRSGRHIARIVHFVPHSDRFPSQRVIYVCHVYCPGSRSVDLPPKEHRPLFTHRFEIVDIPERVIILSKSAKFKNRYPNDLRLAICHYRRLRRENSNAERIWTI